MAQQSKRSVASGIASEHSVFFWARLRLTSIYVLIVAVIVIGFSAFLYQSINQNIQNSDGEFADEQSQQTFTRRTLASVQEELIFADVLIVLAAAGLGYFLAGKTLLPIRRSLEAQRLFSEHASHELRTPLAVMKNDAEVLLRNPSTTKELVHKTLRSSIEEIDRLSSMVANLLALARSQNHVASVEEKADIAAIAQNIGDKMRSLATNKGVSIIVHADDALTARVAGPAFERVLINLLQNAIEHTHKGGSITVETRQEGLHGILAVSDTGSGIGEKDLPHVFERFYKGEGAPGSGLGLSIVKSLVEQHGGNIEVTSTKGKGTMMTVTLPLA